MVVSEVPEDCPTRMAIGLGTGFAAGAILGAVASNWGDVPVILRNKPWPALLRTGSVMLQYGATLGTVTLTYSTVDCVLENVRGKRDWINGSLGGAFAGAVLGLRIGRLPVAIGSAAALAAVSAAVDLSDGKLVGHASFDDGATPPRRIYPY